MLETPIISPSKAIDRPAWIPPEITHDWDSNPYAYQTEEELMPAGGAHNQLLAYMMELLRHVMKGKGLMLLMDTFMLYRDQQGKKQRIAPDLLLMPYREEVPSAYDLDIEYPPTCIIEVTSPKSHFKDLEDNVSLYFGLGIQTYLVIDAITPQGKTRPQIQLHLWRSIKGTIQKVAPDAEGYYTLPEMELKIRAIGQRMILVDIVTDGVLFDNSDFALALANTQAERRAEQEAHLAEQEARLAEQEARLAEQEAHQATKEVLRTEQEARQAAEASLAETHQEIALAMWRKGLDLALIAEVTGLSEIGLKKLIEKAN